jgi:hypothetical protein
VRGIGARKIALEWQKVESYRLWEKRMACLLIFPRPKQRKARPPPLLANYHRKEDESRLIAVMMSSDQAERTDAFWNR